MHRDLGAQLRDIKPLVEIPDNSVYIYWGMILLGIITILFLGYLLYSRWEFGSKEDLEKQYLEMLNHIDWSSSKKAAYRATYYGRLLATDDRKKELFSQLLPLLEAYKYRKEADQVDEDTLRLFELYRKVCNGSV